MKLFTCTDHNHHYPVGVASVVVARDEDEARILLNLELLSEGLIPDIYCSDKSKRYTLKEVPLDRPSAQVLCNGNY